MRRMFLLLVGLCAFSPTFAQDFKPTEPVSQREPSLAQDQTQAKTRHARKINLSDEGWKSSLQPGPAGEDLRTDLSAAHARYRFHGMHENMNDADGVLAQVLETELTNDSVETYASLLDEVIATKAVDHDELAPTNVRQVGSVAIVTPGSSVLELAANVDTVLVNLRNYPNSPEADLALIDLMGQLITEDIYYAQALTRTYFGHPDERRVQNAYYSFLQTLPLTLRATGTTEYRLGFIIGPKLSPTAAQVAGGFRMERAAALFGHDIPTQVAEAAWMPVGPKKGLFIREYSFADTGDSFWPDVIPADQRSYQALIQSSNPDWGHLPAIDGMYNRAHLQHLSPHAGFPNLELSHGAMRASLMVLHGILNRFYPYFDVVGNNMDEALDRGFDEIDTLTAGDRPAFQHTLGRFMHELKDGHGFYGDFMGTAATGYLALNIFEVDGKALVRDSLHPEIQPGDEIIGVNGEDFEDWVEEAMSRRSAATHQYRFELATRELKRLNGPITLELRAPNGARRTETLTGVDLDTYFTLSVASPREHGWMTDLGMDDVYYFNMGRGSTEAADAFMEVGHDARAVILDMRSYPRFSFFNLMQYFHQGPYLGWIAGIPYWVTGDWGFNNEIPIQYSGSENAFTGEVVLLIGPKAVSASETFSQSIETYPGATVMGQTSAGTTGNITYTFLPGGVWASFTGMEVRNQDNTTFHGVGIVPNHPVTPTAGEWASGVDVELQEAIRMLQD